mgnify:CR=1 FL=1
MKVIILGAGAIGSLYGAKLSKSNDAILVARKRHADIINKRGLKITGFENKTYRLRAATKINKIEKDTLIILTTKVYDSEKAIKQIKKQLRKDTVILCLQNGYGSEEVVKKIIGKKCLVLRGITAVGTSFLKPGTIKMNNVGYTAIEKSWKSKEIAENFSECGLKAYVSKNIKEDIWKKLFMNCVLNPITGIFKIKNYKIADKKLKPLRDEIIKECIAVAKKDGFKFSFKSVESIIGRVRKSKNYSSMYQDLLKGKRTEIDYLNGAVVKLGKKYGVKCPVNESLVRMIRFLETRR